MGELAIVLFAMACVGSLGERLWRERYGAERRLIERAAEALGLPHPPRGHTKVAVASDKHRIGISTAALPRLQLDIVLELSGARSGVMLAPRRTRKLSYSHDDRSRSDNAGRLYGRLLILAGFDIAAPQVATGDEPFDAEVVVLGDENLARAVLDHAARQAVREAMNRHDIVFAGGRITHTLDASSIIDVATIRAAVHSLLDLAGTLTIEAVAVPERLTCNALEDPVAEVRRRCLGVLLRSGPERPALAERTSRRALGDDDAGVRLLAARFLDDRDAMESIVRAADADVDVRRAALEHLVESDRERAANLVAGLLEPGNATPQILLRAAISAGQALELPRLGELLVTVAPQAEPLTALLLAEALGGDAHRIERGLMTGLALATDEDDRVCLVHALAWAGTSAALATLVELEAGGPDLREAARHAIERVRNRAGAGLDGRLSVTAAEPAGGLSHSPDGGQLEVAPSGGEPR